MRGRKNLLLTVLHIISWIIFIGVCFEAGAFIFYTVLTLILDAEDARKIWVQVDLSALYAFNPTRFITLGILITIVAVLKAILFYFIVKIFHDKRLDLSQPFTEHLERGITLIAWIALGIGLFSSWATGFTNNLNSEGVSMPGIQQLGVAGADVWIFMSIVLLVIAQIFKKGIEIQTENELTV